MEQVISEAVGDGQGGGAELIEAEAADDVEANEVAERVAKRVAAGMALAIVAGAAEDFAGVVGTAGGLVLARALLLFVCGATCAGWEPGRSALAPNTQA